MRPDQCEQLLIDALKLLEEKIAIQITPVQEYKGEEVKKIAYDHSIPGRELQLLRGENCLVEEEKLRAIMAAIARDVNEHGCPASFNGPQSAGSHFCMTAKGAKVYLRLRADYAMQNDLFFLRFSCFVGQPVSVEVAA